MNKQTTGGALIIVGLIIALVGAFADHIGIGDQPGLGYQQAIVLIVGIIVAIIGLALSRHKS